MAGELVLETVRFLRDRGARFWNAPMFRLREIDFRAPRKLVFSITDFFAYRFVPGTLEDEVWEAVLRRSAGHQRGGAETDELKERAGYLPCASLQDVSHRTCIGGVAALCAFRRSDGAFDLLLQARSGEVADAPGHMSIVPKAGHGPIVGNYVEEVKLHRTIIREIYEEIFGGEDAERTPGETAVDWYENRSEAMKELLTAGCNIRITSLSVDSKNGNYLATALVAVDDHRFWARNEVKMRHMWEHSEHTLRIISSRDTSSLMKAIWEEKWSHDALVGLCEGLFELKRLFPDAVELGDLSRTLEGRA